MDYTPPFLENTDQSTDAPKSETQRGDLGREPTAPSRLSESQRDASEDRPESPFDEIKASVEGLHTRLAGRLNGLQMNLSRATGSNRSLATFPEPNDQRLEAIGGLDAQQLRALSHALKTGPTDGPTSILTRLNKSLYLTYLFEYRSDLLSLTMRWARSGENARVERVRYVAMQTITQM